MAKNNVPEKKRLEKKNWESRFTIIGEARVNDYTYKLDEKSEKSDWIYNVLNLGVDCGNQGVVYSELMGGYGAERDNVLYVHGAKDVNGSKRDDFENKFTIDWEDRDDESILESVGDMCFITIGLEKNDKGKVFPKKFLSPYDAIAYVYEHLEDGMVINVKGNLKYSIYNDNVQVKKEITSIYLSKVEKKSEYKATFTQTMLLSKDSVGKPDRDKGIIPIYAKVLDYVKTYNGKEVKQFIPIDKTFELELDFENRKAVEGWGRVLKVKRGITEATFEGDLIESGALITATEDDIPDDIKELIEIGAYTLEEALAKCTENTGKEKRMVIKKPSVKMLGEEGSKIPTIMKTEDKYSEEDLILDFLIKNDEPEDEIEDSDDSDDLPFTSKSSDDDSWLNQL